MSVSKIGRMLRGTALDRRARLFAEQPLGRFQTLAFNPLGGFVVKPDTVYSLMPGVEVRVLTQDRRNVETKDEYIQRCADELQALGKTGWNTLVGSGSVFKCSELRTKEY